ncbi:MAG: NAD(P)-dependent oxidoreductase [Rhodospirillaceae bacterium]|nr:MAG: NAD(P)-dependent oxidoreductase [Rhodospirillaceae bacterium]
MTIGFIGLGDQGGPIAHRLIKAGHPVVVWARRAEVLAPYTQAGATAASSVADLGARCDLVGICVVDDAGVNQVCGELIPAMRPGSCIAIHSTILPNTCKALAAQAATRGLSFIDAPVSGGGGAAAAGKLTVMIGGDADTVAAARPIFEAFAGHIIHLGGVGTGQMAKLINNTLLTANMGLAHQALAVGQALGIDRAALANLVNASSGRSFGFEVYARLPEPSVFAHGGMLLAKDVRLLGEVMGAAPPYAVLRDVATQFLDLVMKK